MQEIILVKVLKKRMFRLCASLSAFFTLEIFGVKFIENEVAYL